MASQPHVTLSDGTKVPQLAFGVGALGEKAGIDQAMVDKIRSAIQNGWRHFDAAEGYQTDTELGIALAEFVPSKIPRSEFFITTKVHPDMGIKDKDVEGHLRAELKLLKLDYVDLYLIHNPVFPGGIKIEEVWKQMEDVQRKGLTKNIGISNFEGPEIEKVFSIANVKPVVNQVEMHPYLYEEGKKTIFDVTKKNGITVAGYSPLVAIGRHNGGPVVAVVEEIAKKHNTTPAQVLIKWQLDKGHIVVTSSANPERQKTQLEVASLHLDADDVTKIEEAGASYSFRGFGWGTFSEKYSPRL